VERDGFEISDFEIRIADFASRLISRKDAKFAKGETEQEWIFTGGNGDNREIFNNLCVLC